MIKTIKQYNAYNSRKIMLAEYILFPVAVLMLFVIVGFVSDKSDPQAYRVIINTISSMAMMWTIVVICLVDRFNFGAILANNPRINEMTKTSPEGAKMIKNIAIWDIFARLILIFIVSLGILISGIIIHMDKGFNFAMMYIMYAITCHVTGCLLCWICRMIKNMTIATLIYSFGVLGFIPTLLLFIFPGEMISGFVYIGVAVAELIFDVIINIIGMFLLKESINREWYKDSISKGQE